MEFSQELFFTKIQTWEVVNVDKVSKVHNHWEHKARGEEVSSRDEEDGETEGLNLEDIEDDEDKDEERP